MINMADCQYCGAALNAANNQNTASDASANTQASHQWSNTAKTVGTVAGIAIGASVLGGLLRRHRHHRRPPMGPHHGMTGRHHRPGHGGPGHMGGHGPMGGSGGML